MINVLNWIFRGLTIIAILLAVIALYNFYTFDNRDPILFGYEKVEVLNSPIKVGEQLLVRTWRTKVRDDCPVIAIRSAYNNNGKSYRIPSAAWAGGKSVAEYVDLIFDTRELPVGEYYVSSSVTYLCPGITFQHEMDPLRFNIHE